MNKFAVWMLLLVLALGTACDRTGLAGLESEVEDRGYRRGKQYLRENRENEALAEFLKVIDLRRQRGLDAPESHLEAGGIYQTTLQDPITAIYHYRRYLETKPDTPEAPKVRERIDQAIKEFARSLPGRPYPDGVTDGRRLADIEQENLLLRRELEKARQYIARQGGNPNAVVQPPPAAQVRGGSLAAEPLQPVAENRTAQAPLRPMPTGTAASAPQPARAASGGSYQVQQGDTLYAISQKLYGNGNRFRDIFEANRHQLSSPQALRPGMVLVIPQ